MIRKNIEDKFSSEIDAYFKGIEDRSRSNQEEYDELLELGKILADKNFSKNSNKKAVFNKTFKNINKGENIMRKSNKNRRFANVAASLAAVGIMSFCLMRTSFAQELVDKIIKTISTGHVTISQIENSPQQEPVPDELIGKIFDKDGNALEVLSEDYDRKIYTANGEEAYITYDGDKMILSTESTNQKILEKETEKQQILVIKDSNELNNYTCFNVILPSYLPENYKFDRAKFFKDENGDVFDSFTNIFFTNENTEKYIVMQQRNANKAKGYATETEEEIETTKINGVDAVVYDNNIDWEINNIIYGISGRGEITKDELIKIAESIK